MSFSSRRAAPAMNSHAHLSIRSGRHGRLRSKGPHRLCQQGLCRTDRRHQFQRCAGDRAHLSSEAAASDPIYRLANAVRDGVSGQEELRLSRPLDPSREPVPTWYRVKARPVAGIPDQTAPVYAWQIADISAERAEQDVISRIFRRPSIISIMLRQAFSQPIPTAASFISTQHWRSGSASTSRGLPRAR